MPSPFAAAMAAADVTIGATFGEDVRVTPMRGSGGELRAAVPDLPDRPAQTVTGVFTLRAATDRLGGTRHGTELQGMTTLATAPARVWFAGRTLTGLGYVLRAGDRIALVDRPGSPAYAIARHEPSDVEDGTYPLVKA